MSSGRIWHSFSWTSSCPAGITPKHNFFSNLPHAKEWENISPMCHRNASWVERDHSWAGFFCSSFDDRKMCLVIHWWPGNLCESKTLTLDLLLTFVWVLRGKRESPDTPGFLKKLLSWSTWIKSSAWKTRNFWEHVWAMKEANNLNTTKRCFLTRLQQQIN